MAQDSRTQKTLLNVRMNMLCYMASFITAFFTRKILLDNLGAEFIGLTGTLGGILGFLNLAELGVGTAIAYVLYKPIFDHDQHKINEIISVFGYLYRIIGLLIFGAGIILSLFLPLIFSDTGISLGVIYAGFYAYLVTSMIGYFVNYRASLLSADQRNYIVTGFFQLTTLLKVVLQMVFAIYTNNFYIYFAIELTFGIINTIILNWKINQTYPWLKAQVSQGKKLYKQYPDIIRYTKQIFFHKIGGTVQYQALPMIIYAYVSLPMVALYTNYTIITSRITPLCSGIFDSTSAGIGNLISEGKRDHIYDMFRQLFSVRFVVCGILSVCVFTLITPFISVWLGSEYQLLSTVAFLISLGFFLDTLRGTVDQFLNGYGLFSDIWAPLVEATIFIIVACAAGTYWGLAGVLLGPIASKLLIVYIWKPYFLYSKGFKLPIHYYILLIVQHFLPLLGAYVLSSYIMNHIYTETSLCANWSGWIWGAAIFTLLMGFSGLLLSYAVSPALRKFIVRFIKRNK